MSIARGIAARFAWDGGRREDEAGTLLVDVLRRKASKVLLHPERAELERFEFADGSAIIDADTHWDLGAAHCKAWCMMSEGCECHDPMDGLMGKLRGRK